MTHSCRSSGSSWLLMKALSIYCIIVPLKLLFICMDFVRLITKNTAKKWNVIPLLFSFTPFHQCGIVLCGVAIVSSSLLTKKSCGLLLKTGQVARRRNYEGLGELLDILRKQYWRGIWIKESKSGGSLNGRFTCNDFTLRFKHFPFKHSFKREQQPNGCCKLLWSWK